MHARTKALFLVSSSVFLSGAVSAALQDAKTAEQQYKNIQVFKGAPAKDIIPAMRLMANSLGVDCEFCHERDDASDAKQEKKTARQMVLMMRDINEKNFAGNPVVSCATCHQGHAMPPIAPGQLNVKPFGTGEQKDGDPKDVMDKFVKAIGGDAAKSLGPIHLKGTFTAAEGQATNIDLIEAPDSKFVLSFETQNGAIKQGYDGTSAWATRGKQVRLLQGYDLDRTLRSTRILLGMQSLPKYSSFVYAGTETLNKNTDDVLIGKTDAGKVTEKLYFNETTGLLDRAAYFTQSLVGNIVEVFDYSDYRSVGGVKIPFRVEQVTANSKNVRQFDSAEANAKVDDSTFKAPAAGN